MNLLTSPHQPTVEGVPIPSSSQSSDSEFDPAQVLFTDVGNQSSDSLLSQVSIGTPTFQNLKDLIQVKSEVVNYNKLSDFESIDSSNQLCEGSVNDLYERDGIVEGYLSGGCSYEGHQLGRNFSNPEKPKLSSSTRGLAASTLERGGEIDLETCSYKGSEFNSNRNEEPGSINLVERVNKTEPNSAIDKRLEATLLPKSARRGLVSGVYYWGQKQKFKDVPFLLLYVGSALVFILANLVILFKSSQVVKSFWYHL